MTPLMLDIEAVQEQIKGILAGVQWDQLDKVDGMRLLGRFRTLWADREMMDQVEYLMREERNGHSNQGQ